MNYPQALPAPALRRITQKTPDTNYPYQRRYDAAALAGHLPLWPGLKSAVANTCKKCLWHTENNPLVCGQCPLVALLKNVLAEVPRPGSPCTTNRPPGTWLPGSTPTRSWGHWSIPVAA